MPTDPSDSTIAHFPHAFINKRGEPVLVKLLDERRHEALLAMYLAYEPRNSFCGLPPITDEACVRWVRGMIARGIHLVALSFQEGVTGHVALFPMGRDSCELFEVVAPGHQRIGIGTELTRCAVQLAHELGFERVWLSVEAGNHVARHVYKKCGFRYLTRGATGELDMELDLEHYRDATEVPVREIMNRQVVTIRETETCRDALERFLTNGVATLPVVNEEGQLTGILSETDLLVEANVHKKVSELCTRDVVSVTGGATIAKVIRLFQARRNRCIPVVDARRRLVGVVSRKDILAHYAARQKAPPLGHGDGI